jgi:hypothetical protein
MALYSKNDMIYKDYSWTTYNDDNPKITGEPDSTLLNRKEGYEILYFINKFAVIHGFKNKVSGEKVEKMIKDKVPSNIHSQVEIRKWIEENWTNN